MTPAVAEISARLAALLAPVKLPPRAVAHNSELDRIMALPRRQWADADRWVTELTFEMSAWLRLPGSTAILRPIQAVALCELYYYRMLFGPMPVGSGKTLVTFLAPTVLGAVRPMLILPAKLRDHKTPRDFARYAKDWRSPPSMRIISYEQLSRDYGDETRLGDHGQPLGILDLADPDVVMDDEAHRFRRPQSACTRKMVHFMDRHPNVVHVDLSGTMTEKKVEDFAHIIGWTHKNASPVPNPRTSYGVATDWGNALNVDVSDEDRVQVGALIELATPEERATLDPTTAARRGFRRRLVETPGVVAYYGHYQGASLCIEEAGVPDYAPSTEDHFRRLRTDNIMPDDNPTSGGLENWQHEREMARGFFSTWDPRPPTPWKNARTEWGAAVRHVLSYAEKEHRIDSEWQVANACASSAARYQTQMWQDARRAYNAWVAIRDTFKPTVVKVWIDDAPWQFVAEWMANTRSREGRHGLVWVEHIEFAERLSKETGAPYFHENGLDANGRFVEEARPDKDGSIIVSIGSNREGVNLQEHWCNNMFTVPPKGAGATEQALGRTHREGQYNDEVTAEMALWCKADGNAWLNIMERSKYIVDSSGLPAKVTYADVIMPDEVEFLRRARDTARWS